jgi:hypothetical protein
MHLPRACVPAGAFRTHRHPPNTRRRSKPPPGSPRGYSATTTPLTNWDQQ